LKEQNEAEREKQDEEFKVVLTQKTKRCNYINQELTEAQNQIQQMGQNIDDNEDAILGLKDQIDILSNYRQQLDHALQREQDMEESNIKLQREMEECSEFILSLEEKVYKSNKITIELLKQLKDDEHEILDLKDHIKELRAKVPLYCPVKHDPVDKKLAEFINNYRDKHKLKILFVRESEGIYLFGTKRTAIRVENERITVRVGGGYLLIEEFLEQYTPIELQKVGRKKEHKQ
jgi:chromosome segregation ATPase